MEKLSLIWQRTPISVKKLKTDFPSKVVNSTRTLILKFQLKPFKMTKTKTKRSALTNLKLKVVRRKTEI